jgi:predicted 3-demethylubiquinone-9 3-methyltransferase (glyoxalase superfamily)
MCQAHLDHAHETSTKCQTNRACARAGPFGIRSLTLEFTLMGRPFTGLNGGPLFQFNEAISFQIPVETQAEGTSPALPDG